MARPFIALAALAFVVLQAPHPTRSAPTRMPPGRSRRATPSSWRT